MTRERVFVAGHRGLVGSALCRQFERTGTVEIVSRDRTALDLRDKSRVIDAVREIAPSRVVIAAARVGGIKANATFPAEFLQENLEIQIALLEASRLAGVTQVVLLGSSCVYPRLCPQPMREEYLLTGPLEPTNEGYALAKIAGLRLAQYYHREYGMDVVLPMPCNLYGPGDTFDLERSHVLSALVKRFVDAREARLPRVELWGTGQARREFMHVDDLARAVELLMSHWKRSDIVNVGVGEDIAIRDLATLIAASVGYSGDIAWDPTRPDGMPRKCLDVSALRALGFESRISLEAGVQDVIAEYAQHQAERR